MKTLRATALGYQGLGFRVSGLGLKRLRTKGFKVQPSVNNEKKEKKRVLLLSGFRALGLVGFLRAQS